MYKQIRDSILTNDIPSFIHLIDNSDVNFYKKSIYHLVVRTKRINLLKILVHKNVDRSIQNEKGETAFHICCKNNWIVMAKSILYRDGKEYNLLSAESKKLLTLKNNEGKTVFDIQLKNNFVFQWLRTIQLKLQCKYCLLEKGYNCHEHLCIMCYSVLSVCTVCHKSL